MLLPTALIHIESSGELYTIRALLDAGTERRFITSRIQQKLALLIEKHHSHISGFGRAVIGSSKPKMYSHSKIKSPKFHIKNASNCVT